MPAIRKVAVLGAGALGAMYASHFFQAPGFETVLFARGERQDRLNREGITVNGATYAIPAVDPSQTAAAPADLILVALKHHQLNEAASGLENWVGPDTVFLSVMNGLESEQTLGAMYGMEKVLYAIALGVDAVRSGGAVRYTVPGFIHFGEAENSVLTPRVRSLQTAFDQAKLGWRTPPDMIRTLWWKFMINVGINQASAILRAPYGLFQTNPDAQALMETLMHEAVALAQAEHVDLNEQDVLDWYPVLRRLSPAGKTSMLQDIEAGRQTEVEIFGGKAAALGAAHNIATPLNQAAVHIIRAMQA